MSFEEISTYLATYARHYGFVQRKGQAYFNGLYEVRPDLADEIRGTHLDPFYDDGRIESFLIHVASKTS